MPKKKIQHPGNETLRQVDWIIRLRWVAVVFILFFALLVRLLFPFSFAHVLRIAFLILANNVLAWLHYRHCLQGQRSVESAAQLNLRVQITFDILVITWSVHLTGGAESMILPFYLVHTPLLGLATSRRTLIRHIMLISLLLGILFGLEYYGIIPHINHIDGQSPTLGAYKNHRRIISIWMAITLFLILGTFITNYIRGRFQFLLVTKEKAFLESESLRKVALSLSSTLDWEETLYLILASLKKLASYDTAAIILFAGEDIRIIAGQGIDTEMINAEAPAQSDCIKNTLEKKRKNMADYIMVDKVFWKALGNPNIESALCMPMISHNKSLGLLAIGSEKADLYEEKDVFLAQSFGNYAAISLENSQLYESARQQARTDGLTGLDNLRSLHEYLEREERRSKRYGYQFSILMCDLDKFKGYNDAYGHLAGDDLLRELAN